MTTFETHIGARRTVLLAGSPFSILAIPKLRGSALSKYERSLSALLRLSRGRCSIVSRQEVQS